MLIYEAKDRALRSRKNEMVATLSPIYSIASLSSFFFCLYINVWRPTCICLLQTFREGEKEMEGEKMADNDELIHRLEVNIHE